MFLVWLALAVVAYSQTNSSGVAPPYYQPPAYTRTIDSTQSKFENQLAAMNDQLAQIDSIIQNSALTSNVKIKTLAENIAD